MLYIVLPMPKLSRFKIIMTAGLALFAMFFGAGNMVFPLAIGADAGDHIVIAWLAFMISGVGLPFLGLFAISLYEGNYWDFFSGLGRYLSFAVITFIILILGPIAGAPRTEDITYNTLATFLPSSFSNYYFSIIYFAIIFLLSFKHTLVIDIIGRLISPIKLIAFLLLIVFSLIGAHALLPTQTTGLHIFTNALSSGYGTMDLLAAFFFCHIAYKNIVHKCRAINITDDTTIMAITLKACLIGALLIGLVYSGFMFAAATHASELQRTNTAAIINRISHIVLGSYGSLFVCLCVSLACIATATALAVVSSNFFYKTLFRRKLPRTACLLIVLIFMYCTSILGFDGIMSFAGPILDVLYPSLIIYCVYKVIRKLSIQRKSALSVA